MGKVNSDFFYHVLDDMICIINTDSIFALDRVNIKELQF